MQLISSTSNRTIKKLRKLTRKKGRRRTGWCLIEGIQQVLGALENDAALQVIVICPDLLTSDAAYRGAEEAKQRGVRVLRVTEEVFESISQRDNPVGMAAAAEMRYSDPESFRPGQYSIVAVLHGTNDPGNLGTVIRTVDSMGGDGVVLLGNTTDPYHPRAIRASVGTVFGISLFRFDQAEAFLRFARSRGITIITTSARAEQALPDVKFEYPCALLFGSEDEGLPSRLLAEGDMQVRIPIFGQASSLNLAVAAGIILYEARRDAPDM